MTQRTRRFRISYKGNFPLIKILTRDQKKMNKMNLILKVTLHLTIPTLFGAAPIVSSLRISVRCTPPDMGRWNH